mmetsp:Transcript_36566/g.27115  ORF Transcript_36566/g.27115 Transcript_36566/m.27115 type:complete len:81 (+) Transcript_36566:53-295(+)
MSSEFPPMANTNPPEYTSPPLGNTLSASIDALFDHLIFYKSRQYTSWVGLSNSDMPPQTNNECYSMVTAPCFAKGYGSLK